MGTAKRLAEKVGEKRNSSSVSYNLNIVHLPQFQNSKTLFEKQQRRVEEYRKEESEREE